MRRLSARTAPTAVAAIVVPALMVLFGVTPATAAATPGVEVASGFARQAYGACAPDGNGATIPLTVVGSVTTLTATSSNQTLLPDSAIAFGGSGGQRNVTIAVVPGPRALAVVTITVSDGAASSDIVINVYADGPMSQPQLFGTLDSDLMLGQGGDDHLISGTRSKPKPPPTSTGRDTLCGGEGNDHLEGQDEEDTVDGQAGNDIVKGAQGNDIVIGGDGDDKVSGRGGSDFYSCGDDVSGTGAGDTYYGYRTDPQPPAQPDTSDGSCDDATNGSHK